MDKITKNAEFVVQLLSEQELKEELGEGFSSIMISPAVAWTKFVLTDDLPNANNQRVPSEEFQNLIDTGKYMPIKMAVGSISEGHDEAIPLGVITNLKQEANTVIALAALWSRERPADIEYIKSLLTSGTPVNISWEILFGDYSLGESGVMELRDLALRAATIVGLPAYQGRTPVLAVAAKKWSKAFVEALPNESFLYIDRNGNRFFAYRDETGRIDPSRFQVVLDEIAKSGLPENTAKQIRHQVKKMRDASESGASLSDLAIAQVLETGEAELTEETNVDELETLKQRVVELEAQLQSANDALAAKEAELATVTSDSEAAKAALEEELTSLRALKNDIDAKAERATKLGAIKDKFVAAGIEKSDEYFGENEEHLLSLDEAGLDFMLQELVSFKETVGASNSSLKIPPFSNSGKTSSNTDPKEIGRALREQRKAK